MKKTLMAAMVVFFVVISAGTVCALDPIVKEAVGKEFKGIWNPPGGTGSWTSSVEVKDIFPLDGKMLIKFIYKQETGKGSIAREIKTELIENNTEKQTKFKFSGDKENVQFTGTFTDDGRLKMELNFGNRYLSELFEVK